MVIWLLTASDLSDDNSVQKGNFQKFDNTLETHISIHPLKTAMKLNSVHIVSTKLIQSMLGKLTLKYASQTYTKVCYTNFVKTQLK